MSKKHFIELANVVRKLKPACSSTVAHDPVKWQWEMMRDALADFCKAQNGNFNRERWLGYIAGENGPGGGKVSK